MRRTLLVLIVAVLLFVRVPIKAEDLVYTRFGNYLESLRAQAGIPGLSAIVVGPEGIQWERTFGYADIDRVIAIRTDTPVHLDGLTEAFAAALVLRCAEEGRLSLDAAAGQFQGNNSSVTDTVRQILTHTLGPPESLTYSYRPERLELLGPVIRACTGDSYRETLSNFFDEMAMTDSVPGPDVIRLVLPAGDLLAAKAPRYASVLDRLAVPYSVDNQRRASRSQYKATTLTPVSGIVSTALDLARFDLALKNGDVLDADTLGSAWRAPSTASGQSLPHAFGWFVQNYNGEAVVWQFGIGDNGSSSMMLLCPARGLTLILVANSNGLAKAFQLERGDATTSPFGRVFLATFIR